MKIAIFHDYFDKRGGGELLVLNTARALGADIYTGFIDREKTFDTRGVRVISLGINKSLPHFLRIRQLITKFKKIRLDSYDFYIFSGNFCIAAVLHHKPNLLYLHTPLRAVYDLHDYFLTHANPVQNLLLRAFAAYWKPKDQFYMKQFDIICPNSDTVKKRVLRYYGKKIYNKCETVYTGITTRDFYHKPSDGFYLSASRLDPLKRVDLLIHAFIQMPSRTLVITGTGPDEKRLRALARDHANIRFVGPVSHMELLRLYATCTATLCANIDEDLGLVPIESHAAGKPSLVVHEGGFRETTDTTNGMFFKPTVPSLIKTITDFEQRKWDSKAIQRSAKPYDISVFVRRIKKIIRR